MSMEAIPVVGEVVSAATALAGLVLIYLGSLVAGYEGYQPTERKSVRKKYQRRAWFAFAALLPALIAALLGVLGKWLPCEWVADAAVLMLFAAFVAAAATAFMTVREIV